MKTLLLSTALAPVSFAGAALAEITVSDVEGRTVTVPDVPKRDRSKPSGGLLWRMIASRKGTMSLRLHERPLHVLNVEAPTWLRSHLRRARAEGGTAMSSGILRKPK